MARGTTRRCQVQGRAAASQTKNPACHSAVGQVYGFSEVQERSAWALEGPLGSLRLLARATKKASYLIPPILFY